MNNEYSGIERRTGVYRFQDRNELIDHYSQIMPKEELLKLISDIDNNPNKPFTDRNEGETVEERREMYLLQRLKRIEWEMNRFLGIKKPNELHELCSQLD